MLFERYLGFTVEPSLTREGLQRWYDGYYFKSGRRLYNPRSVVTSLKNNNLGNYWTSAGPYDEIYYYIEQNVSAVRDDLALMAAGIEVPVKIWEYAATSMRLWSKEEIFSAVVVYGFLTYKEGKVLIPNRELLDKFTAMLRKEPSLGYVDFIFYPETDKNADCIILELKAGQTPEDAIRQIKEKKYAMKFQGRIGGKGEYTGRVLAVGISYDRKEKKHSCKIEVLS